MRRRSYLSAPRCTHTAAAWTQYETAQAAHWDYEGPPEDRPPLPLHEPTQRGYCDDCWRALCQPGAVWPPEVWASLNAMAANDYAGCRGPDLFTSLRKLPPAPKARRESIETWYARAIKALAPNPRTVDVHEQAKLDAIGGTACNEAGTWAIETTNGYTAILRHTQAVKPFRINLIDGYGEHWIDLPEGFWLALNRVRLLANQRSGAVRLSYVDAEVMLSARCDEGTAAERIGPLLTSETDLPPYETTLAADYLDAVCGVWPLRWYLRPPNQHERDTAGRTHWTEDLAQIFEPGGSEYRVAIMPMRE